MEQKKPIILQVDESTKRMMSELEGRISDGFADTLGDLKTKISSSSDAIESLKAKLNKINDIRDAVDESSSKSDEIKRSVDNLIKVVSSQLNVDFEKFTSDDPLDKQATKGDIENIKSSIVSLQEKQADIAGDVTSDFKKIVETTEALFLQGKEHTSHIENSIKETVSQADLNIRQQFEASQDEMNKQFDQNQSVLQSQSAWLAQNAETLHNILKELSSSFEDTDGRLKELATALVASRQSYSDQLRASFDSSRADIKSKFSQLDTTIRKNDEKMISDIQSAVDSLTSGIQAAKAELTTINKNQSSQILASIRELKNHIDDRFSSIEKDCSDIAKDVEFLHNFIASEGTIIKENQANIQKTLNEVLYHTTPFWNFKARKVIKQLIKQ